MVVVRQLVVLNLVLYKDASWTGAAKSSVCLCLDLDISIYLGRECAFLFVVVLYWFLAELNDHVLVSLGKCIVESESSVDELLLIK